MFIFTHTENIEVLGMEDGSIDDCQITASSDDGTQTAVAARPNADGWISGHQRGPPLYQNDYVQVKHATTFCVSPNLDVYGLALYLQYLLTYFDIIYGVRMRDLSHVACFLFIYMVGFTISRVYYNMQPSLQICNNMCMYKTLC